MSHSHSSTQHIHSHDHNGIVDSGHSHTINKSPMNSGNGTTYSSDSEVIAEAEHFCDIIFHFSHYATYHENILHKQLSDYYKLSSIHQSLLSYIPQQHQLIINLLYTNQQFIEQLIDIRDVFYNWPVDWSLIEQRSYNNQIDTEKMSKIRSTLKQCVRDWSSDGIDERAQCYKPIIDKLNELYGDQLSHNSSIRVLIPGAGLCRLVWEIARLGYVTQGNEFSYFMLICSYYILNCCVTTDCHTIYPYITESKNWLSMDDRLQPVNIPDVSTRDIPNTTRLSMVAGDFYEIYNDLENNFSTELTSDKLPNKSSFHCVCSCYFIDCAPNILDYISTISYILQDGGYWINFGPLLYHFSDVPNELSIDLTWAQIVDLLPKFGLKLIEQKFHQYSQYTQNKNNMMQQSYNCVFAVIQKVGTDSTRDPITQSAPPQSHNRKK